MKNFRNKLLSLLAAAALMVTMVPAALALEDDILEPAPQPEVAEVMPEAPAAETVNFSVYHFYLDNKEALKDSRNSLPARLAETDTSITNAYAISLYDANPTAPEYILHNGAHYQVSGHSFHVLDKNASPGSSASEIQIADEGHIDLTNASDVIIHIMYDVVDATDAALDVYHYYGSPSDALQDINYPQTIAHDNNTLTDAFAKGLYNTDPSTAVKTPVAPLEHGGIYLTSGYDYNVSYNNGAEFSTVPVAEAVEGEDSAFLYLAAATNVIIYLKYDIYYPVTATVDDNGTAAVSCTDPNDNENYRLNSNVTVTFSADDDHHITAVTDNGKSVDDFSSGELVLNNLAAAHKIVVTTAPDVVPPSPTPDPNPNPNPNPQPTAPIDPVVPVLPEEPIVLPENVTPLAPAPEAPVTSTEDGVILIDAEIPLGDLPQTGMTPAALSVAAAALMALSALVACAGIFFKKRQNG